MVTTTPKGETKQPKAASAKEAGFFTPENYRDSTNWFADFFASIW
jgi:hypothetical protein